MSYQAFAKFYDLLTQDVDYQNRVLALDRLIRSYGKSGGLLADLACGTGSMSALFCDLGYDVIGIDGSADMLMKAQEKAAGRRLLLLKQSMPELDLYGTVDTVVCSLDSINHLVLAKDVRRTFERVSLFLNPGGLFLFDANTVYKHRFVLGDETFVYDYDSLYCVWQNALCENNLTEIHLDFFQKSGNQYNRSEESFQERGYHRGTLTAWLRQAGLRVLEVLDGDSFSSLGNSSQRTLFVTQKEH